MMDSSYEGVEDDFDDVVDDPMGFSLKAAMACRKNKNPSLIAASAPAVLPEEGEKDDDSDDVSDEEPKEEEVVDDEGC